MNISPAVARIDLERVGSMIFVHMWKRGWNCEDAGAPHIEDIITDETTIATLLADLEKQGFTCNMFSSSTARALRGHTTRIDFVMIEKWEIRKYPYGWIASTRPIQIKAATAEEIAVAIKWCEDSGWNVRKYPGGARAFLGKVYPVRDATAIRSMRRKVQNGKTPDISRFFDYAFDY